MNSGIIYNFDPARCRRVEENTSLFQKKKSLRLKCETTLGTKITFSGKTTANIGGILAEKCIRKQVLDGIKNIEVSASASWKQSGLHSLFAMSVMIFFVALYFERQKEDDVCEHLLEEI